MSALRSITWRSHSQQQVHLKSKTGREHRTRPKFVLHAALRFSAHLAEAMVGLIPPRDPEKARTRLNSQSQRQYSECYSVDTCIVGFGLCLLSFGHLHNSWIVSTATMPNFYFPLSFLRSIINIFSRVIDYTYIYFHKFLEKMICYHVDW